MAVGQPVRVRRRIVQHPSAILLIAQLLGVVLYPYMEQTSLGRPLFEVFGVLVLALAIWAIGKSVGPIWVPILLGGAGSALSIADAFHHSTSLALPSAVLHALFYFWAVVNEMVYMLSDLTVTSDELWAVGATFTLGAWACAYVFTIVQIAQPGCFSAAVNANQPRTWMELLFLSFTTLSSTGLSEIVPITAHARAAVMLEPLAGLGYVALFVSRLVGLTISRQMTPPRGE